MKIRDIVTDNRIITVPESDELYTRNINRILQREINSTRIKSLKNYIIENSERFFSSLIVAIHKGSPKWTDIDLYEKIIIDNKSLDEQQVNFLSSKFGILTLSGDEEIFALDGQHRLKGIRQAFAEDDSLKDLEIPVIFVIHNHKKVEITRRLFTVLNKYAEKPKGAELIILDEDDVAAINTRRLVVEHPVLSKPNALSSSKSGSIPTTDRKSFTTLVTIYNINKKLYSKQKDFYQTRPRPEIIDDLFNKSKAFWDTLFKAFPELIKYIDGNVDIEINGRPIKRNEENGGNLLLRPAGQEIVANAYIKFTSEKAFINKIRKVDFNLDGKTWKYIFWNGKILSKEVTLKKNILLFLVGKYKNKEVIHQEVSRVYKLNNQIYKNHIQPV